LKGKKGGGQTGTRAVQIVSDKERPKKIKNVTKETGQDGKKSEDGRHALIKQTTAPKKGGRIEKKVLTDH